jgi:hypothetical protein
LKDISDFLYLQEGLHHLLTVDNTRLIKTKGDLPSALIAKVKESLMIL